MGLQLKQRVVFYRQLAVQLDAGVGLTGSLAQLERVVSGPLKRGVIGVRAALDRGATFGEALRAQPAPLFSPLEVELLAAAEQTGHVDRAARKLEAIMERRKRIQDTLVGRLAYPVLILHLAILLPSLVVLVMQGVAAYLAAVLPIIGIIWGLALACLLLVAISRRVPALASAIEGLMRLTPVIKGVREAVVRARACRTFAELHDAGVAPVRAMRVAALASASPYLSKRLEGAALDLEGGATIGEALLNRKVLPPLEQGMVESGEIAGKLGHALGKVADHAEDESARTIDLLAKLGPALAMVVVALYVGYVVVSAWGGIYGQIDKLSR